MNRQRIIIVGSLAVLAAVGALFYFFDQRNEERQIVQVNTFEECVRAGYPSAESNPRQCRDSLGRIFVEQIKDQPDEVEQGSDTPKPVTQDTETDKSNLIRVTSPRPNQLIESPLEISGEARGNWFFEASFPAKLLDANGKILVQIPVMTHENWMTTDFVPFNAQMTFPDPETKTGSLILEKDNPSGLPEYADKIITPVTFSRTAMGTSSLSIYLGNSSRNAECESVLGVRRSVEKTPAIARAALDELLKGPTAQEESTGYSTALPSGVRVNSLRIENGVAYADFNEALEKGVAGSCRVNAIRSQITETLKQFSSVREVRISINGKTDGILQP